MNTEDIIRKVMDDITPTEYPNLYSAGDVEEAIRKALEMQARRVSELEKEVSDAGWREEAVREKAWIERGDDGMDWMRMP